MSNILPTALIDELESVARKAAEEASKTCLHYYKGQLNIDYKGDASPVTIADQETEQKLRDVISASFPEHGIFGEEHGQQGLDQEFVWVLDPIDGTKSFISGNPLFGMLISVLHHQKPVFGMMHMPAIEETFIGRIDKPGTHNGQKIATRSLEKLSECTCYIGEADKLFAKSPSLYPTLVEETRLARFGYDCYSYGQLAAGHIDIVIETGLHPYDFFAVVPVVEAAGGIVTDWQGNPMTLESNGDILASSNKAIHEQALSLLN